MSAAGMTPDAAAALRAPFPPALIGKLPKGGGMLDYVGHADVTSRLLEVDPEWGWEPVAWAPDGTPMYVLGNRDAVLWIRLTVCGVSRLGVGIVAANSFELEKQLISDCLVEGTLIWTERGHVPIESVRIGDLVMTRAGWRPVSDHWLSHANAPVDRVTFSDGGELVGTPHHPVWVEGDGFVHLGELRNGAMMLTCQDRPLPHASLSSSAASSTASMRGAATTSAGMESARSRFTGRSTKLSTGRYRRDGTSTTSTTTPTTTTQGTCQQSHQQIMPLPMREMIGEWIERAMGADMRTGPAHVGVGGAPLRAKNGHEEHRELIVSIAGAQSVAGRSASSARPLRAHAAPCVLNELGTGENESALSAAHRSWPGESGRSTAGLRVVSVRGAGTAPVWNLTVDGCNEFYAAGVLTHNSIRNAAMRFGVALDLWAKHDAAETTAPRAPEVLAAGMVTARDAKAALVDAYSAGGAADPKGSAAGAWKAARIAAGPIPQAKLDVMLAAAVPSVDVVTGEVQDPGRNF